MEPVRCFIGCAPDGHDAESCAVLEYTLRKHASAPVEIVWLIATHDPASMWSGWDMSRWATPFSGFRHAVPAFCGFEGRAVYMDSDTIVQADIAELWRTEIAPGKVAVARGDTVQRFCVSLWDCSAAAPHMLPLDALKRADGHDRQTAYFRQHPELVQPFDGLWNYLDTTDKAPLSEAKVVHYTDISTQPSSLHARKRLAAQGRRHWYDGPVRKHPRRSIGDLFEREFAAAQAAGFTVDRYIPAERFGEFRKRKMTNYRARR